MKRLLILGVAAALLLSAWSGVMLVDADEVAVIYRFGAISRTANAGLSLRLPAPIEHDERVRVTEVRRVEPGHRILLTGDTNLVVIDLVAQYTISDPVAFSVNFDEPEAIIADALRGQTAAQVSRMEVDFLLTTGRSALQQQVKEATQLQLNRLGTGVALDAVELRALEPPDAVVAAFNDVESARGDRDTMILAAQSYASRHIPDVRGQAARLPLRPGPPPVPMWLALPRCRGSGVPIPRHCVPHCCRRPPGRCALRSASPAPGMTWCWSERFAVPTITTADRAITASIRCRIDSTYAEKPDSIDKIEEGYRQKVQTYGHQLAVSSRLNTDCSRSGRALA